MHSIAELENMLEKLESSDRIEPLLNLSFMLHMSNLPRMRQLTEEALEFAQQFKNKLAESRAFNNMSVYWGVQGEYEKSLDNAFKSLEILLELNDKDSIAGRYNNISLIYKLMNDKSNSIKYCNIALEEAEACDNTAELANGLNNMATILEIDGEYLRALSYYMRTAELLKAIQDKSRLGVVQINIVRMYIQTSQLAFAQDYIDSTEKIAQEVDNTYLPITLLMAKGELASAKGNYEESLRFLTDGLEIAKERDEPNLIQELFKDLVDLNEKFEHYHKALQYYRELIALKDKIQTDDRNRHMNQLRAEFDFREKEREAEIYRLKNVELQAAKEAAEAANIAKGNFLAIMSHEIRTPLSILQGMLELTQETALTDKQKSYLSKAGLASKSLLSVINDILDFSKISADKVEYESIVFNIRKIVDETVSIFKTDVNDRGLYFNVEYDELIPEFLIGDPFRLGQIIRNLIANAVKFTASGGITFSTVLKSTSKSDVSIQFCVKDTGIGIEPGKVDELFEPFSQAESSFKRRFGGTGLGLAICNRLAEGMNGKMWVESVLGEGSSFIFSIPFEATSGVAIKEISETESCSKFAGARILLVDDVDTIREIAGLFLQNMKIDYVEASNGLAAVEKASSQHFDLIMMDVQMPEMDGLAATRKIRATGNTTTIIAMTAHAMNNQIEFCKEVGMNDVLTKPFSNSELLSMLQIWL